MPPMEFGRASPHILIFLIVSGTVVDSKICHPTEFDFYLCSHAGIQVVPSPLSEDILIFHTIILFCSLAFGSCFSFSS
jgi:hypothetical protein